MFAIHHLDSFSLGVRFRGGSAESSPDASIRARVGHLDRSLPDNFIVADLDNSISEGLEREYNGGKRNVYDLMYMNETSKREKALQVRL